MGWYFTTATIGIMMRPVVQETYISFSAVNAKLRHRQLVITPDPYVTVSQYFPSTSQRLEN